VLGLRVNRRWGPVRIAYHLHLNISTVHRILTRYLRPPLRFTDLATEIKVRGRDRARRYEYAWSGEIIHVDIKKLGHIREGGGHRVQGRVQGEANSGQGISPRTGPRTAATHSCIAQWIGTFGAAWMSRVGQDFQHLLASGQPCGVLQLARTSGSSASNGPGARRVRSRQTCAAVCLPSQKLPAGTAATDSKSWCFGPRAAAKIQ